MTGFCEYGYEASSSTKCGGITTNQATAGFSMNLHHTDTTEVTWLNVVCTHDLAAMRCIQFPHPQHIICHISANIFLTPKLGVSKKTVRQMLDRNHRFLNSL
jgi:hypothetical protein